MLSYRLQAGFFGASIPWKSEKYGEKMTSESSEYVATQQLRTSSVPQLLNYTLLEASKDLEWTQSNQISMWTEVY